jgi:uncharacterized membrane protein YphA (DoxX/SURF4 family)
MIGRIFQQIILAHENYVLPKAEIDRGMGDFSVNVFSALKNPHNFFIGLAVALSFGVVILAYYFFMTSRAGIALDRRFIRLEPAGHAMLRLALAASFIASGYFNSFLGPEIPLSSLPFGDLIRPLLYIVGLLLILGLFTELASIIGLAILAMASFVYKDYMLTYFNYFGEFLALIFFGSRFFSFDKVLSKTQVWLAKFKDWEIPVIRIAYGISVLYPAITIKILHPSIIIEIVQKYNLAQFHWLFPSDPLLISLGTGLAQIAVGLCIIAGFETRLNALITFVLYLMSILFFKEAVWPHYILLALALYLVINDGGGYSVDRLILKKYDRRRT